MNKAKLTTEDTEDTEGSWVKNLRTQTYER